MKIQKQSVGEAIQDTVVIAVVVIIVAYIALLMAGAIIHTINSL